jgi:hypothetical protein
MFFTLLTFFSAFVIEGLGTATSVIGLSAMFGSNPIIIALAVALDLGKVVTVSLLYKYWKKLSKTMRAYALIASFVTMTITSTGGAAYLSGEFQRAIQGTQEVSLKVKVLKDQQFKYEERKKQIDLQIASLPEKTSVTQRLRLMNGFKAEQQELQKKITALDTQLPDLQLNQIDAETKAGPVVYVAKAFDVPVEVAVKYVILLIMIVFDPLAVFLIVAGNFLYDQYKLRRDRKPAQKFELPVQPPSTSIFDLPPKPRPWPNLNPEAHTPLNPELGTMPIAEARSFEFARISDPATHEGVHYPESHDFDDEFISKRKPEATVISNQSNEVHVAGVEAPPTKEAIDLGLGLLNQINTDPLTVKAIAFSGDVIPNVEERRELIGHDVSVVTGPAESATEKARAYIADIERIVDQSTLAPEPAPRPEITLADLQPHVSSLNAVKADETIRFDDAPPSKQVIRYNQGRGQL